MECMTFNSVGCAHIVRANRSLSDRLKCAFPSLPIYSAKAPSAFEAILVDIATKVHVTVIDVWVQIQINLLTFDLPSQTSGSNLRTNLLGRGNGL